MKLTLEMLVAYQICPLMYQYRFGKGVERRPTFMTVQQDSARHALQCDLEARTRGEGLTLADMMSLYMKRREELLLQCEFIGKPASLAVFKNHATHMFTEYLKREAPLLHPEKVNVRINRKLDDDLELEASLDGIDGNEITVLTFFHWKVSRNIITNNEQMLMPALITGISNFTNLQFILRAGFVPARYNIFIKPEKLVWFEHYIREIVKAIQKEAFPPCQPSRAYCNKNVCQQWFSCRGLKETI